MIYAVLLLRVCIAQHQFVDVSFSVYLFTLCWFKQFY